jgi:hypothetical protein
MRKKAIDQKNMMKKTMHQKTTMRKAVMDLRLNLKTIINQTPAITQKDLR